MYICYSSITFIFISVPPSKTMFVPSQNNPLCVGDFLNITCSTDSSNPQAYLDINFNINNLSQYNNVYSAGDYNGNKVARSLSGVVNKVHNGVVIGCYVIYNTKYVMGLKQTYTLNVTCMYLYVKSL